MKNDCNLPEIRDLTAVPSDELNARTLAAMEQVIQRKTKKKMPLARRITVCAALFCAALVLMGAGVRLYEHLTFVPGMGVVTVTEPAEPEKEVFTLARVVETEAYRIEAVSMIPAEDEEHAGMWEVSVLTDQEVPDAYYGDPEAVPSMILYGKDHTPYSLSCAGYRNIGTVYTGYAVIDPASETNEYPIYWNDKACTLSMISVNDTVWANYRYPVSDGITAVVFPLAEGSCHLAFDVIFEPESENMRFWKENSELIQYTVPDVTVTDIDGTVRKVTRQSGQSFLPPGTEADNPFSLAGYKIENILTMESPLTAEIAEITIDKIIVDFRNILSDSGYTVRLPEPGKTVPAEELPDGGVFFDGHGIRIAFDEMTTRISEQDTYELTFRRGNPIGMDFEENVTDVSFFPSYYEPDKASDRINIYTGSYTSEKNPDTGSRIWYYTMPFHGAGDRKKIGLPLTFGDEVLMYVNMLKLTVAGDWHIDFTAEHAD